MAFSQEVIIAAWKRAGGRCECRLEKCRHLMGRCNRVLDPANREPGKKWHAHHVISQDAGGSDSLKNCQILCIPCHEKTGSYGK